MSMITVACVHCKHSMQLPANLAGKQGKCPSCGQIITVPNQSFEPINSDSTKSKALETAKIFGSRVIDLAKTAADASETPSRTSNNRYPNLSNYIRVMEKITTIGFWIQVAILLIVGVGTIIASILGIFRIVDVHPFTMIAAIIGMPIGYLILVIWRMVCNASTEAMRVFMDIEQNTREISQLIRNN